MLGGLETRARRWTLGITGATLVVLVAGCPDTFPGGGAGATGGALPDAGSGRPPTLEWRQTVDLGSVGMRQLRGWMRFTSNGTRAYVAGWSATAALMTVDESDGTLSAPTKLMMDACNMSDIHFSADEQVAFVSSYYKASCGEAIASFHVDSDGQFGGVPFDRAWSGSTTHEKPDLAESFALHPNGAWLYVGFANRHPSTSVTAGSSEIHRVAVTPDGALSDEEGLTTLGSREVTEVTLAFPPEPGDALYAVEHETGKVSRFHVEGATGELMTPPSLATASSSAEVGPVCMLSGKEHVYVSSAAGEPAGGGIHHLVFSGAVVESSTVTGGSHHPGLQEVFSIVRDESCRYLYAVGRWGAGTMLHVLEVDPTTGNTTWVSGVDGIEQLESRQRISISPDGRFLYTVAACLDMASCTRRGYAPPVVHVFEILTPSTDAETIL